MCTKFCCLVFYFSLAHLPVHAYVITDCNLERSLRKPLYSSPRQDQKITNSRNEDDDDDDDDESDAQLPYRNRSLAWSNRYRNLIPYDQVRTKVIAMGFYSKDDWDEFISDGKNGPYIPSHPDQMYATDWTGWDDFLGLIRDHDDASHIVQHILKLHTLEDYTRFIQDNAKRAEHLRIPLQPHIVYRGKGWISYDHFFGTMQ
jgi:protein tyrosine phosphatase